MLETNIDDMSGEVYSHVMPKLLAEGALDVYTTPIMMKKNRPANILSVICHTQDAERLAEIVLTETSTFGIRRYTVDRFTLEREVEVMPTEWGDVHIKLGYYGNKLLKVVPEYEDCHRIAKESGFPFLLLYQRLQQSMFDIVMARE